MRHDTGAVVLADSITPAAVRVTTIEATFPRPILAELNTHRLISKDGYEQEFSRNSASSRAIPTEKNIARLLDHPFVPRTFNARVAGMGVGEEFDAERAQLAREVWMLGRDGAVDTAIQLNDIGLDKSRANRVMEPYMWHTAILTATEWSNFFGQRAPDGGEVDLSFPAAPEIQELAIAVRTAMRASKPKLIEEGNWHVPYFDHDEEFDLLRGLMGGLAVPINDAIAAMLYVSARRLARVSFDRQNDEEQILHSYSKGTELQRMSHYSPLEHQVRPVTTVDLKNATLAPKLHVPMDIFRDQRVLNFKKIPLDRVWCGNLRGVVQFRKLFADEDDAMVQRVIAAADAYTRETA